MSITKSSITASPLGGEVHLLATFLYSTNHSISHVSFRLVCVVTARIPYSYTV